MRATAMLDRTMSAKTKAANRKTAVSRPGTRFRQLQRRERPTSNKGDCGSEKDMARRKRLIEHQPKNKENGARYRKADQPAHVGPMKPFGRLATGPRTPRI